MDATTGFKQTRPFAERVRTPSGAPLALTNPPATVNEALERIEAGNRGSNSSATTKFGAGRLDRNGDYKLFPFIENAVSSFALDHHLADSLASAAAIADARESAAGEPSSNLSPSRARVRVPGTPSGAGPRSFVLGAPSTESSGGGGDMGSGGVRNSTANRKALLDGQAVQRSATEHQALQEQIQAYFPAATLLIRGGAEPAALEDLNLIFADGVRAVYEGQLVMYHTAMRTLEKLSFDSKRAGILLRRLSAGADGALPVTVERELATMLETPDSALLPSPLDRGIAMPPFGAVAAKLLAALLVELESGLEAKLLAACQTVSILPCGALGLTVELGDLRGALGDVTPEVHPSTLKEPMNVLMQRIADSAGHPFRSRTMDWVLEAQTLVAAHKQRKRVGGGPTARDFLHLVGVLERLEYASAELDDTMRGAGGGSGTSARPVLAITAGSVATPAAESTTVDDANCGEDFVYQVRGPSIRVKCTATKDCSGMNPTGSLICTTCSTFLQSAYICKCNLPARAGERCRIYFCDGLEEPKRKILAPGDARLKHFASTWVRRFKAARATTGNK
jgi:hypothetical protein